MGAFEKFKEKLLKEDISDMEKEDALEAADMWINNEIRNYKWTIRELTEIQQMLIANDSYENVVKEIDRKIAFEMKETDPKERREHTIKALTDLRNAIFNKSL